MIKYNGKVFRNLQEQVAKNMEDIETLKQYEGYMGPYATTSAIPEEDLNQDWLYLVGNAAPYELYKYNADGTFTDLGLFPFAGPKGDTGDTGVGIVSVTKTGTSGLVDTYTITLSNGQTSTFTVTNGEEGPQGVGIVSITKTRTDGRVDTYTITLSNGQTPTFTVTNGEQGVQGPQGVGIVSITKTGTSGLVDTYTITLSNGLTSTFTVTNGYSDRELYLHHVKVTGAIPADIEGEITFDIVNFSSTAYNSYTAILQAIDSGEINSKYSCTGCMINHSDVVTPDLTLLPYEMYASSSYLWFKCFDLKGNSAFSKEIYIGQDISSYYSISDTVTHITTV